MWKRPDERGSVSLWLALAAAASTLMIGIAVDLGGHVHAQQRVRDIAAQATRVAGNQVMAAQAMRGQRTTIDPVAARAAATRYLDEADITGQVTIESGGTTLRVTCSDTYDTVFLGMIGINQLTVSGESTARLVRAVGGNER